MELEIIKKVLAGKAVDGNISCKDCLAIAEELDVTPAGFARILTDMDIKIVQCQLSCFP